MDRSKEKKDEGKENNGKKMTKRNSKSKIYLNHNRPMTVLSENAAGLTKSKAKSSRKPKSEKAVVHSSSLPFTLSCPLAKSIIHITPSEIPPGVVDIDAIPLFDGSAFDRHYGAEILYYMKELEKSRCLPSDFLVGGGFYVLTTKARGILINWLIQVQHYLGLSQEAIHLCVRIADLFFSTKCVLLPTKIQLVGITSLLISCKVVERFAPKISALTHLTDDTFTKVEVLEMEQLILNTLNFELVLPEPMVFLDRCYQLSGAKDKLLLFLSWFLVDLMLPSAETVHCLPSLIASSSFCLAKKILYKGEEAAWNKNYQFYSGYTEEMMKDVMQMMVQTARDVDSSPYKGTWEKYSSKSRYLGLATLPFLKPRKMEKYLSDIS